MNIDIRSEVGKLQGVILHTPGKEIEQMTPQKISTALYSDLLNISVAEREYFFFNEVLKRWCTTFQVKDLLIETLCDQRAKKDLIGKIIFAEHQLLLFETLMTMPNERLATVLIEGLPYREAPFIKPNDDERYVLLPLYNLFFVRDTSSIIFDRALINSMKSPIRRRETLIMEAIFNTVFKAQTISPLTCSCEINTEGGDILIASEDTLFIGCGSRTNEKGVEFIANHFAQQKQNFNIVVQYLPQSPESFIHLDMVFTLLGNGKCMIYEPLIAKNSNHSACHIEINNGKIKYNEKSNFMEAIKAAGFDLEPVLCGGSDRWKQEREQWHSGANFFALDEGKIIGYARNSYTIEALNNSGFEVLRAIDIVEEKEDMNRHKQFVVTFDASELPRGGGGARCMTMPVNRSAVKP